MSNVARAEAQPRMWGGRFTTRPSAEMDALNRSLPVDRRMWRQDVAGSLAWALALCQAGVIAADEENAMRKGLHRVAAKLESWDEKAWADAPDEDIHSLVERLLTREIGDLAGKLHTGRSRNDQVATDARLWAMAEIDLLDARVRELEAALLEQAEAHVETVMPGYTHMQRAQPVTAAHWLLSHLWPLERDRERLADARRRVATLPLGSGALAGCPFPVDRVILREMLGFRDVSPNSIDAVADRDWVAELLFVASMIGVHLSRLAEDVVLFASSEFRFVRLPDDHSTGSSLMPQKRNPDAMELARGKAGRLIGELTGMLATLKGLPSGYNKDLQEDKAFLFSACDTLATLLPAVTGTVSGLVVDSARCLAAVDASMLATDLADALVRVGVPFRRAHELVGHAVRAAEEQGCSLDELSEKTLRGIDDAFGEVDVAAALDARAAVERKAAYGGTGAAAVREQIRTAGTRLQQARGVGLGA